MNIFLLRLLCLIIGFLTIAFGVSMMISVSEVGLEPWQAFHVGLANNFPIFTIGIWTSFIQLIFILCTFFIEKTPPKFGTFLNMLMVGPCVDLILHLNLFHPFQSYMYNMLFFILGVTIASVGAALAIVTNLGPGAKTQFYVSISKRFNLSLNVSKTSLEMFGLFGALFLSGPISLGTLVFTIISGPIIAFSVSGWKKLLKM